MNYLSVENISKSFGERTLFKDISFGINKDQKIAFIAKNGSGKTCIMNIINGEDEPDTGQVVLRKGLKMAFLSQKSNLQDELTIEESIFASDNEILHVIEDMLSTFNEIYTFHFLHIIRYFQMSRCVSGVYLVKARVLVAFIFVIGSFM